MTRGPVQVERRDAIWLVRIDRPDRRNAVDRPTAEALAAAFRAFEASPESKVGVLAGAGGMFSAGADLKAVGSAPMNRLEEDGDGPMGVSRMHLTKPVIAAISGHAVAGGLELALWCDLRVAEEDAVLGVFCRRFGVPLIDGGTVRLPRLIGVGRALDLILTGRPVLSDEALAMGLVNRVVPKGKAEERALALAETLSRLPQECLRSDRQSVYEQQGLDESAALAQEFRIGRRAFESPEMQAGVTRFRNGEGRGGT